jgi:hypothetical protein
MYRKNGPSTLFKGHEGSISSCCISDDCTLCVSGGYDTKIVLWDMAHLTPKLLLRVNNYHILPHITLNFIEIFH